jgi:hypothetical protein
MNVALCTPFGPQRHIHTFPRVLGPRETVLMGRRGAWGELRCQAMGGTLPTIGRDPFLARLYAHHSGQKSQNALILGGAQPMNVTLCWIDPVESHIHRFRQGHPGWALKRGSGGRLAMAGEWGRYCKLRADAHVLSECSDQEEAPRW